MSLLNLPLRLIAICVFTLATVFVSSCKLELDVEPGGKVYSLSGANDCYNGVCEFDMSSGFSDTFNAVADPDYVFVEWSGYGPCEGSTDNCTVSVSPQIANKFGAIDFTLPLQARFERIPVANDAFIQEVTYNPGITSYYYNALALSPDGKYLYVAGGTAADVTMPWIQKDWGDISVYKTDPVTGELQFVQRIEDGVNGITGLFYPTSLCISPDGKFLYVAAGSRSDDIFNFSALGDRLIQVYSIEPSTGVLSYVEDADHIFSGLLEISMTPDGSQLLAIESKLGTELHILDRDQQTGALSVSNIVPDTAIETPDIFGFPISSQDTIQHSWSFMSVALSDDGAYLYLAVEADNAAFLFAYERNVQTGELERVGIIEGAGLDDKFRYGRKIVVGPNSDFLYFDYDCSGCDTFIFNISIKASPAFVGYTSASPLGLASIAPSGEFLVQNRYLLSFDSISGDLHFGEALLGWPQEELFGWLAAVVSQNSQYVYYIGYSTVDYAPLIKVYKTTM